MREAKCWLVQNGNVSRTDIGGFRFKDFRVPVYDLNPETIDPSDSFTSREWKP